MLRHTALTYSVQGFKEYNCIVIRLLSKQVKSCCLHRYHIFNIWGSQNRRLFN